MQKSKLQSELNRFFRKRTLASTYKPYFLKAILELVDFDDKSKSLVCGDDWISKTDKGLSVKLDFIASRFGFYYWDTHFKFRLKQSPNPTEDVHIHKILDDFQAMLGGRGDRPKITVFCSPKYEKIRARIISRCIKPDVLRRFLNDCAIYEISPDNDFILVPYEILDNMKANRPMIQKAIDFIITEYLETCNSSPQIATKIAEKKPISCIKQSIYQQFVSMQNNLCFYCNKRPIDAQEHVIPKDYVWETKPHNIVGACEQCNRGKWYNKLPKWDIFKEVLKRNDDERFSEIMKKSGYSREAYELQYRNCHLDYAKKFWTPN
jgi:hypothetical protein